MLGNFSAGSFLTELYMCSRANDLRRFGLGPFAHSTTYNGFDLTGSTWQASTFAPQAIPGLGFKQDLGMSNASLAAGGDANIEFAWINGGPAFAPSGGFIFKNTASPEVIGATQLCDKNDNSVSYRMTFKQGIDVGTEVPDAFSVGRMARVTLPALMNAGAKRYTWIHGKLAKEYFSQLQSNDVEKGGFLYEVNDAQGSRLEFYERTGYSCDTGDCSGPYTRNGGGVGMASTSVNAMNGGGGNGMTIRIELPNNVGLGVQPSVQVNQ